MILKSEPLSMAETKEYINEEQENFKGFIGKFTSLSSQQAKDMRKKLEDLNLIKAKGEHLSKIIDLLPTSAEEMNKIFTDVNLDEDEIKKIADIVKQFK